jgi:hypothetical protein
MTLGLDLYSRIFFWYLVGMTGYWFVFFKLQERVSCFMPSYDVTAIYREYDDILISLICIKIFVMMTRIVDQSGLDIFLVDWEPVKWFKFKGLNNREYRPK